MLLGLNHSSGSHCVTAWSCVEAIIQHSRQFQFCVGTGNAGYAEPLTPEQQHQVIRNDSHERDNP